MRSLTIIMPAYNEEGCIRDAVRDVGEAVLTAVPNAVLLVVNDGSRDRTGVILDEIAREHANVDILHQENGGHGSALLAGLARANAEYILLLDSDRQIPLTDFAAHWEQRRPDTVLCGVRTNRCDPGHRLLLTRLVRLAIRVLFGRTLNDGNVPYKLVPAPAWERIRPLLPPDTLTPSLFLAIAAARDPQIQLVEVPVAHLPRRSGKVSLVSWRLVRFCFRAGVQLLQLRRELRAR